MRKPMFYFVNGKVIETVPDKPISSQDRVFCYIRDYSGYYGTSPDITNISAVLQVSLDETKDCLTELIKQGRISVMSSFIQVHRGVHRTSVPGFRNRMV